MRKIVFGPYDCPKCGKNSLVIKTDEKELKVYVHCGCGFKKTLQLISAFQPVDYYSKIIDDFYKGS